MPIAPPRPRCHPILLSLFLAWALVPLARAIDQDLLEGGDATLEKVKKSTVSIYSRPTNRMVIANGFEIPRAGQGSGVLISADGYILTALHVVNHSDFVYVRFHDRSERRATVVGIDRNIDFALLKLDDSKGIEAWLDWGDSTNLKVGQKVIAVGIPLGLSMTFTAGIISFLGRCGIGLWPVEFYLQTDAPINPGNSGGPLITRDAKVVGLNDAGMPKFPGLGFAVPTELIRPSFQSLIKSQKPVYAWLGVYVREAGRELEAQFNIKSDSTEGLYVFGTTPGSPAHQAGLRFGDTLLTFDGAALRSFRDLAAPMLRKRPGDQAALTFRQGAEIKSSQISLTERQARVPWATGDFARLFMGVELGCQTNDDPKRPFTNAFRWSVSKFYTPEGKPKGLGTNQQILGFSPAHPYAYAETLQGPDHFADLLGRCYVEDDLSIAFSVLTRVNVNTNIYANYPSATPVYRDMSVLQWLPFEDRSAQMGF